MPNKSKLAYKIYSEGNLHIELAGNVKIDLDIVNGKSYFIRSPNSGVSKLFSEEISKRDFNQENRPDLYTSLE